MPHLQAWGTGVPVVCFCFGFVETQEHNRDTLANMVSLSHKHRPKAVVVSLSLAHSLFFSFVSGIVLWPSSHLCELDFDMPEHSLLVHVLCQRVITSSLCAALVHFEQLDSSLSLSFSAIATGPGMSANSCQFRCGVACTLHSRNDLTNVKIWKSNKDKRRVKAYILVMHAASLMSRSFPHCRCWDYVSLVLYMLLPSEWGRKEQLSNG